MQLREAETEQISYQLRKYVLYIGNKFLQVFPFWKSYLCANIYRSRYMYMCHQYQYQYTPTYRYDAIRRTNADTTNHVIIIRQNSIFLGACLYAADTRMTTAPFELATVCHRWLIGGTSL